MNITLSLKCIERLLTYAEPKFNHYDLYNIEELHSIVNEIPNDILHESNLHKVESHYFDKIRQKDIHRIFLYRWDDWQTQQKKEQASEQQRQTERATREATISISRGMDTTNHSPSTSRSNDKRLQLIAVLESKSFLDKAFIKQIMKGSDSDLDRLYKRYNII